MSSYTLRKALDVIESHNLRDEHDPSMRRYRMRDVSNSDVQRLADVWNERVTLLSELQQLDTHERQILERYASIANGLLYSRQVEKEREAERQAEQKKEVAEREATAQAEKAAFVAQVRKHYTGLDSDFEAVANSLWQQHVTEQTQRNMDKLREEMLASGRYNASF